MGYPKKQYELFSLTHLNFNAVRLRNREINYMYYIKCWSVLVSFSLINDKCCKLFSSARKPRRCKYFSPHTSLLPVNREIKSSRIKVCLQHTDFRIWIILQLKEYIVWCLRFCKKRRWTEGHTK